MFCSDPEGFSTGDDHLQIGRTLQDFGHADTRCDDLLEVVEHQEHLSITQSGFEDIEWTASTRGWEIKSTNDRLKCGVGVGFGGNVNEEDSISE